MKKKVLKVFLLSICCISILFTATMSTSAYSIVNNKMILGPCAIDLAYYDLWNTQSEEYTLNGEIRSGSNQLVYICPRIKYFEYKSGSSGDFEEKSITASTHYRKLRKDTASVYLAYSPSIIRNRDYMFASAYYEADYNYPSNGRQKGWTSDHRWNFG